MSPGKGISQSHSRRRSRTVREGKWGSVADRVAIVLHDPSVDPGPTLNWPN